MKAFPSQSPTKYWAVAEALTVSTQRFFAGSPSVCMGKRSGHSQTADASPAGPKSDWWVQFFRSGEE